VEHLLGWVGFLVSRMRKLDHSIVVAAIIVAVSLLASGLTVDTLSTFCGVFMVEFGVLLFDCFVCRLNVTCLKRFTRYDITQVRWKT